MFYKRLNGEYMSSSINEKKGDNTMMKSNNIIMQLARLLEKQKLISENERLKMLDIMREGR